MHKVGGRVMIQAGAVVSLLGYAIVALIIGTTAHVSSWGLFAPLLVVGLGMGLFVVSAFDTIVASVTDAELGSASGALNAIQQLGGAIGVAVIGTVFFSTLSHHGFAPALEHAMWWSVGALSIVLLASPLLPARARPPEEAALAEAGVSEGDLARAA